MHGKDKHPQQLYVAEQETNKPSPNTCPHSFFKINGKITVEIFSVLE
jgi:hypothetical protein